MQKFQLFKPNRFVYKEGEPVDLPEGATHTNIAGRRNLGADAEAELEANKPAELPEGSQERIDQLEEQIHKIASLAETRQGTPAAVDNGLTDAQVWNQHLELLWVNYYKLLDNSTGDKKVAVSEKILAQMTDIMARFEAYLSTEKASAQKTSQVEFVEKKQIYIYYLNVGKLGRDVFKKQGELRSVLTQYAEKGDNIDTVNRQLSEIVFSIQDTLDEFKELNKKYVTDSFRSELIVIFKAHVAIMKQYIDWVEVVAAKKSPALTEAEKKQIDNLKVILGACKKFVDNKLEVKT